MSVTYSNEPTVNVPVKSAWLSKINWGEAVKLLAMAGAWSGLFTLDVETQNHLLMLIISLGALYTWAMKTFFSNSVTPSSAKK